MPGSIKEDVRQRKRCQIFLWFPIGAFDTTGKIMRIPIAKEIQEKVNNGDVLVAIEWFKWTLFGLRFTYHTAARTEWSCSNLHAIERSDFSEEEYLAGYEIDDKFPELKIDKILENKENEKNKDDCETCFLLCLLSKNIKLFELFFSEFLNVSS